MSIFTGYVPCLEGGGIHASGTFEKIPITLQRNQFLIARDVLIFIEQHMGLLTRHSLSSGLASNFSQVAQKLDAAIGHERMTDPITPATIDAYRDAKTAKVRANREIGTLSHVFNIARMTIGGEATSLGRLISEISERNALPARHPDA